MDEQKAFKRFAKHVGYTETDLEHFQAQDPRRRQIERLARAAPKYSILAEVVQAKNCNSGYQVGDRLILDVDGNFLAKLCPPRLCVYALAQFVVPVALINERLSEDLDPNHFHFMKFVSCPDAGVDCAGYGQVRFEIKVVPRVKAPPEKTAQ